MTATPMQQPDPFGAAPPSGPSGPRAGFGLRRDGRRQTWHDTLAGCVVVPASAYPVG